MHVWRTQTYRKLSIQIGRPIKRGLACLFREACGVCRVFWRLVRHLLGLGRFIDL